MERIEHLRPYSVPCHDYIDEEGRKKTVTAIIVPIGFERRNNKIIISWACVPKRTLIETPSGTRDIENIKRGDLVYSYSLQEKKLVPSHVTKTFKREYSGSVYLIKPYRLPSLRLTPEHPILVRLVKHISTRGNYRTVISEPQWLTANVIYWLYKFLRRNMRICVAYPFLDMENDIEELTAERLWLMGWYMAEGYLERRNERGRLKVRQVRFTLNVEEMDIAQKIQMLAKQEFGANSSNKVRIDKRNGNRYREVRVYSTKFAEFIRKWCHGRKASTKKYHNKILTLPKEKQRILLDTMFMGDGYPYIHHKTPTRTWGSTSRQLAQQTLKMAIRLRKKLGYSSGKYKGGYSKRKHPFHQVSFFEGRGKFSRFFLFGKNIVWTPIQKIVKKQYSGFVYNLEVLPNQNYIANFLVHNCSKGLTCRNSECRYSKASRGVEPLR